MLLLSLLVFGQLLFQVQNEKVIENLPTLNQKIEEIVAQRKVPSRFQPLDAIQNEQLGVQVREISKEESKNISKPNQLPKLVPLVFPPGFFEKEGKKIISALETKMKSVFGEFDAGKIENMDSPEALFDLIEHKDFNSFIINFVVKHCIKYLRPKGPKTVDGISSREECRKACHTNNNSSIQFAQRLFQAVISRATNEDLRFSFSQDSRKCFMYFFDPVKNVHSCECVDKGFKVKVSPRLLELIKMKFFQKDNVGDLLAEEILEENSKDNISNMGNIFKLKKLTSIFLSLTGFKKNDTRGYGYGYGGYGRYDDRHNTLDHFMSFLLFHFVISVILFVFCHCIWYFHLIYFGIALIGELMRMAL